MAQDTSDAKSGDHDDVIDAEIVGEAEASPSEPHPSTSAKPVEPVAKTEKKGGKLGWMVSAVLLAFIGGLFAAPYAESGLQSIGLLPQPTVSAVTEPAPDLAPAIESLTNQMDGLARKFELQQEMIAQAVADAEAAGAARERLASDIALLAGQSQPTVDAGASDSLRADLDAIRDDIARLSLLAGQDSPEVANLSGALALARAETAQLKAQLDALSARTEQLQAGALEASPRGRLLLLLSRVKDNALAGRSLGADLVAMRPDIATLPALDQQLIGAELAVIGAHTGGISAYEQLVRDFDTVARDAKFAAEKADGGFLANLITVRRTDTGATGIDAALRSAQDRLAARDVTGAIDALAGLSGPAAEAIAAWRERATDHVNVLAAINRLQRAVSNPAAGGGR